MFVANRRLGVFARTCELYPVCELSANLSCPSLQTGLQADLTNLHPGEPVKSSSRDQVAALCAAHLLEKSIPAMEGRQKRKSAGAKFKRKADNVREIKPRTPTSHAEQSSKLECIHSPVGQTDQISDNILCKGYVYDQLEEAADSSGNIGVLDDAVVTYDEMSQAATKGELMEALELV
ncbi:hypothetical protein LZ30DRAFT_769943 [Colletotrichum cereale]|nr:hypothetical protein LZ30DRAFT_769943 [Colletotrichum cereale]